jgi:hypothetical protein
MEGGDAASAGPTATARRPPLARTIDRDARRRRRLRSRLRALAVFAYIAAVAVLGLNAAGAGAADPFRVNDPRDLPDARIDGVCRTSSATGSVCTLRAALQEANATQAADTIELPSGFYAITIRGNGNAQGDFDILRPLTILGAGATSTIIDGGQPPSGSPPDRRGLDRVFETSSSAGNVTLSNVTIQEGYSAERGGGIENGSSGTLLLENVTVRENYAGKYGGGLDNVRGGRVRLEGSVFSGNGAVEGGAALNNTAQGRIEIVEGSEVSENPGTYPINAGAIHNEGQNDAVGAVVVNDSDVVNNQAIREGAGISNDGDGTVRVEAGSTISGNRTSASGGGISSVSGNVTVTLSTISDNQAGNEISTGNGGGIYNAGQLTKAGMPGRVEITGTLISGNGATGDGGGIGGGLAADLLLTDSTVVGNSADSDGGGISIQSKASMTVRRVFIRDNRAAVRAGGVYSHASGSVSIDDALFHGNESLEEGGAGLYTDGSGTVAVSDSKFSENVAVGDGGGVAIHSSGLVTISSSEIVDNVSSAYNGGGLENSGMLVTLSDVTITGNDAALDGGGIHNTASGEFTLLDTTIEDNIAENGGGFANAADSTLVIRRTLISANKAELRLRSDSGLGGGIYSIADGDALIENSTVSGNTAETAGGGVYNDADANVRVVNVTITDNTGPRGSGFALEVAAPPSTQVVVRNTIIAANHGSPDCDGGLGSEGGNIDGGTGCQFSGPGDLDTTDPQLAPLADNGGPTKTHALLPGSRAISLGVAPCPLTDQRGFGRPPTGCDAGAYELDPPECVEGTVTLAADADSWVLENSPDSNYGDDTVLKVDSKDDANARALVHFDLASSIPSGCQVEDAALRLYASAYKEGRTLQALSLGEAWTEPDVTWETQPPPDEVAPSTTAPSGAGYVEWDVTSQAQAMHAGANHGFLIRDAVEDGGGFDQGFNSREKAPDNPPQLVVSFG